MKKRKDLLQQKKVIAGIGIGVVALIAIGVILVNATSTKINFTLKDNVVEYGTDYKKIDWLKKVETNGNKVSAEIDTKKLGQIEVEFHVCINDDCSNIKAKVVIKDTKAPEIKLKKDTVEIEQDSEFDPASNIESVKDIVDGDIKKSDKETKKDGYYTTGEVDGNIAGEYTIKVIALDKNGNKSEKEYKVKVKEKEDSNETETGKENTEGSATTTPKVNTGTGQSKTDTEGNTSTNIPTTEPSVGSGESNTTSPASQPTQEPTALCPNGTYPEKPCEEIVSGTAGVGFDGIYYSSEAEAINAAESAYNTHALDSYSIYWHVLNNGTLKYFFVDNDAY